MAIVSQSSSVLFFSGVPKPGFNFFPGRALFALFCALLRAFLRTCVCAHFCALVRSFACFYVRQRLERQCLRTAELKNLWGTAQSPWGIAQNLMCLCETKYPAGGGSHPFVELPTSLNEHRTMWVFTVSGSTPTPWSGPSETMV